MTPSSLIGKNVREVDTPALLIDADALDRNLECMAKFAAATKLNYRPPVGRWRPVRAEFVALSWVKPKSWSTAASTTYW